MLGAHGHFGQNLGHGFVGLLVDVGGEGGPSAVDGVGAAGEEKDVEEELGVEGEDVRDGRMAFNEGVGFA